ncbi:MAG: sulfate/molybdate ABC transporter ATP-binding protein [Alphaproteobacteria bacterium]
MGIEIQNLHKRYATQPVLRGVDLRIGDGELVALLGASGSGKTTLLRILVGLDWPDTGDLRVDGESWLTRPTQERGVGFVPQNYALFDHMTVADNIAFGLRVRDRRNRPSDAAIRSRVDELLGLIQLDGLGGRYPSQLSGGQRQRVALARALAVEPQVLLLDEPFGALDARVRQDLRQWLRDLHDRLGMTTVFVTHDQEEALELADKVVILNEGRIEQIGSPEDIYDRPESPYVLRFLGGVNELPALVRAGIVDVDGVDTTAVARVPAADGPSTLFVRPHHLDARAAADGPATIRSASVAGNAMRLALDLPGIPGLTAEMPRDLFRRRGLAAGDRVALTVAEGRVFAPVRLREEPVAAKPGILRIMGRMPLARMGLCTARP